MGLVYLARARVRMVWAFWGMHSHNQVTREVLWERCFSPGGVAVQGLGYSTNGDPVAVLGLSFSTDRGIGLRGQAHHRLGMALACLTKQTVPTARQGIQCNRWRHYPDRHRK